jgi:hypothetical protein
MTKNFVLKSKKLLDAVGFYLLWFGLAALGVVVALQFQVTFVYLGILLVESPFRPPAWNSSNIAGVNRCGYLIIGVLWLGLVFYLEKYLEAGLEAGHLWTYALRAALMLGGVYLLCAALLYVLG